MKEFGLEQALTWDVAAFKKRQKSLEGLAMAVWPLLEDWAVSADLVRIS